MELILFGDIEDALRRTLIDDLNAFGRPCPVYITIPNPRPSEFVIVRRIGGARINLVTDSAQVSIEAYAPTAGRAHSLIQTARTLITAMRGRTIDGQLIHRVVEYGGPALLPDPDSDHARYVITADVEYRGRPFNR